MNLYKTVQCSSCERTVCQRDAKQFKKTRIGKQHPRLRKKNGIYLCEDCFGRYEREVQQMDMISLDSRERVIDLCRGGIRFAELAKLLPDVLETDMELVMFLSYLKEEGVLVQNGDRIEVTHLGNGRYLDLLAQQPSDRRTDSTEKQLRDVYDIAIQLGMISAATKIMDSLQKSVVVS